VKHRSEQVLHSLVRSGALSANLDAETGMAIRLAAADNVGSKIAAEVWVEDDQK
jgi:hypothetical protein